MRQWLAILGTLVIASSSGTHRVEAASPSTRPESPSESVRNERAMLKVLWPALDYGRTVGRIYYRAGCQPDDNVAAAFPLLDVRPASKGISGLAAVRDIFGHEKGISVNEADPGIIRIRIGSVPDAVLRVRIANLVLTPVEQYNYWLAIFKIQSTPEVRSAMQELMLRIPVRVVNMIITQPADGLPHLPAMITNVTADQALDLVAKTFRGIVLYQFCAPPDQFEIDFADASYIYATPRD